MGSKHSLGNVGFVFLNGDVTALSRDFVNAFFSKSGKAS